MNGIKEAWILKIHLHLSNIIRKGGENGGFLGWSDTAACFSGPPCLAGGTPVLSSVINNCLVRCYVWNKASFLFFFFFFSPWLKRTVLWEMAIVFTVFWWWNVICLKYFCNKLFHSIKPSIVWPVYKCNLHYNALRNPRWKTPVCISSYQHTRERACVLSLSLSQH